MNDFSLLGIREQWPLLKGFGITSWFFNVNISTIISTWGAMAGLVILVIVGRYVVYRRQPVAGFLVLRGVSIFMDMCTQSLKRFEYGHFTFITTLFTFILACNLIGMVPLFEEPTADLNTPVAFALITFFYVTYHAIRAHGLKEYIAEYFRPIFIMFPLHVLGKFSSIISLAFRLFGNILGGSIITKIFLGFFGSQPTAWYLFSIPLIGFASSIIIYAFFGLFEGIIQAFVFTMLSLTTLSAAINEQD